MKRQPKHPIIWRDGRFILPLNKPFESDYPVTLYQFKESQREVLELGSIVLPLISHGKTKDDRQTLTFYHPDMPNKLLLWSQQGMFVNKAIDRLIKQLEESDQITTLSNRLPIISVTPDKIINLYDNNYTPPKIEITDYIDPTPEMTFLMNGGVIKQSYGVVFLIDADGVKNEVEAENNPDQVKMMFDLMLHYSESKTKDNGRKIRMILYNCLSYKEETLINTMRSNFIKYGSLKDGQYGKVLRIYQKIIEDLMG